MLRPSPHKIFYSPSKKSLHNKYKSIPSSSSSSKRNTIIKNNNNVFSTEEIIIKKEEETISKIDDTLLFLKSKKFSDDSLKNNMNNTNSFSSIFVDKLKKNQKLKEKNIYLKNILKELNKINNSNSFNKKNSIKKNLLMNNNNNNNLYYYNQLKKDFSELKYYNKSLKEEYSILKLESNNNINIKKIFSNKEEVISKIKSLNYSINNFLDLLSTSMEQKEHNKMNDNLISSNPKQKQIKNHNHNKFPNSKNRHNLFLKSKNLRKNASELIDNYAHKNRNIFYKNNHIRFTDERNLNTNYYNENSEEFQISIPLKKFEKTITNQLSNKKFGSINSDIKNEKKLTISESNKIICSFAKSLEYNNKKNGKEIKEFHTEKNKFPSKIKNKNFINGSLMNKSAKLFHLNQNTNSSNIRQNKNVMKSNEKNKKNQDYNFKQNSIISKKIDKIFTKPIKYFDKK